MSKIRYLISDRFGGVSPAPFDSLNIAYHVGDDPRNVDKNRLLLYARANIPQAQFANQIHSNEIVYIPHFSTPPTADGLITDKVNLPLAVMVADCFGVLLFDQERGVIAALHAGRKGATLGIVEKGIKMMREQFGAKEIKAIISPGIHSCCYEISPSLAKKYPAKFIKNGKFLDIKQIIYEGLARGGVESVKDVNICTSCNPNYYSYRRDKVTGRFAVMIWREE
ncbi:MAG: peptidoglycan editing factor PgeF [Epsilonproteobacteria bacterium]|nr:peptidoglycan editing factor PgeF [Campylobacterota bacterium]